jgi:hypothetical protein
LIVEFQLLDEKSKGLLGAPQKSTFQSISAQVSWNEWLKFPIETHQLPKGSQVMVSVWMVDYSSE